jgi:hypothetical protein
MPITGTADPTTVIVTVSAAVAVLAGAVATIFAEVTARRAQGTGRDTDRRARLDRLAAVSRWVE